MVTSGPQEEADGDGDLTVGAGEDDLTVGDGDGDLTVGVGDGDESPAESVVAVHVGLRLWGALPEPMI